MVVLCALFLLASALQVVPMPLTEDNWYEVFWGGEFSGVHGNPVTDWYEISQWEIDVCFGWGGTDDPNSYSQDNVMGEYYHNLMVSLQAEVSDPLGEEEGMTGKKIYEVAWFIQPTDLDETINFEVYLVGEMGVSELIESTSSNYVNGIKGYDVRESDVVYESAKIVYWNDERPRQELVVPFVA